MNYGAICLGIWATWWGIWLLVGCTARVNGERQPISQRAPYLGLIWCSLALIFGSAMLDAPPLSLGIHDDYRQWGIVGTLAGLAFACWARWHLGRNWSGLVTIKHGHELVTSGPYRYMRHPIYAGLVAAMLNTALAVGTLTAFVGAALWCWAFAIKARNEDKILERQFAIEYQRFRRSVPARIFPGWY